MQQPLISCTATATHFDQQNQKIKHLVFSTKVDVESQLFHIHDISGLLNILCLRHAYLKHFFQHNLKYYDAKVVSKYN